MGSGSSTAMASGSGSSTTATGSSSARAPARDRDGLRPAAAEQAREEARPGLGLDDRDGSGSGSGSVTATGSGSGSGSATASGSGAGACDLQGRGRDRDLRAPPGGLELHRAACAVALPGDGGLGLHPGDADLAELAEMPRQGGASLISAHSSGGDFTRVRCARGSGIGSGVRPGPADPCNPEPLNASQRWCG